MLVKKLILFTSLIVIHAAGQSVGGSTSGAAAYCDSINSGFISLNNYNGQVLFWESSTDNGSNWTQIGNPTSTQSYYQLNKTTSYRAIVQDGTYPQDTSTISTITIHIPGIAGKLNGGGTFCHNSGPGSLLLENAAGNLLYWQNSEDGGKNWQDIQQTQFTLSYNSISKNTLYRAVVQTVPGCPADTSAIVSFSIQQLTVPGLILKSDSVCYGAAGDTLRLTGNVGAVTGWIYSPDNGNSWQDLGTNDPTITYTTVTKSIWYRSTVKNGLCPQDTTAAAIIAVYNTKPADAGPDITITKYESTMLSGKGTGQPAWNNGGSLNDSLIFNPAAKPLVNTTYVLTITDEHGCTSSDSVRVRVFVPIPTAITPNGDGLNDFFEIDKIDQYLNNSLRVFDRWGIEVYNASPYKNDWNGKSMQGAELADGVYYYVFDYGTGEKPVTNYIYIKRGG
jgi:gliding motility-associated-like protein